MPSQTNPYASLGFDAFFKVLRSHPECVLNDATHQPTIRPEHAMPNDLRALYVHCGGLTLFPDIAFPVTILPPERVALANPIITGLDRDELIKLGAVAEAHPSWSAYTLAEDGNGDYFAIDLGADRQGWCYDAHHERWPRAGDVTVLAYSFAGFLARMLWLIESRELPQRHWPSRLAELSLGSAF